MDAISRDVLVAADAWFSAVQAVTAADEERLRSDREEEALDGAEIELAVAVMAWRNAGRPD
jgi:hypothetical protein